jgi:uncharacterized protein YjbI with pentapeptide repeats
VAVEEKIRRCVSDGCAAAALTADHCLSHLGEGEFARAIDECREGRCLDARDAVISSERLATLVGGLTDNRDGYQLPEADLEGPTFPCAVRFDRAIFVGVSSFRGAKFARPTSFDGATFRGGVDFSGALFEAHADFDGAHFEQRVSFRRAVFSDHAGFEKTKFGDAAHFDGATFRAYVDFDGASFAGDAMFTMATFQLSRQFGPLSVARQLSIDECVFDERIRIEAAAATITGRGAIFAGGAEIRARWAEIALDNADFTRASSISAAPAWPAVRDVCPSAPKGSVEPGPRPRLVTLRGANVGSLSLSGLDLRPCRFFGAQGLPAMTVEAGCVWPHSPQGKWRAARETIAEEHEYRSERWNDASTRPPRWLRYRDGREEFRPEQLAALYRALRKAREDSKDLAGANDLYYGEMEMRRSVPVSSAAGSRRVRAATDRAILLAYWAISGYGLKASRAIATFAALVILGAVAFATYGFEPKPDATRALIYSLESTSSLIRSPAAPGYHITYTGEVIQMLLRLLGPLLVALALLAIRARIKR